MEQFFQSVWSYLQSTEFNAILTSVLAVYAVVRPIINKVLSVKSNSRLEIAKAKISKLSEDIATFKAEAEQYKQVAYNIKSVADSLVKNAGKQAAAMKLAFDRSNLKEDVKTEIAKLLPAVNETLSEVIAPIKATAAPIVETAKEIVSEVKENISEVKTAVSNIIREF